MNGEQNLSSHYLKRRIETLNNSNNELNVVVKNFNSSGGHKTITNIPVNILNLRFFIVLTKILNFIGNLGGFERS